MPAEPESYEQRIARLKREGGRADLIVNGVTVAGGLGVVCMMLTWLLGAKSPWGQVFGWATNGLLCLMVLLIVVPNVPWPKFVRKFFYGPERELSDEEKTDQARRDLISKDLETLKRPISWAFDLSYFTSFMITIQWFIGEFEMSIGLGIALTALVTIAGLILWGQHRINVYFRDHQ